MITELSPEDKIKRKKIIRIITQSVRNQTYLTWEDATALVDAGEQPGPRSKTPDERKATLMRQITDEADRLRLSISTMQLKGLAKRMVAAEERGMPVSIRSILSRTDWYGRSYVFSGKSRHG
ncbi:MAG: hypothetical protein KAT71_08455 [Gammaproteobacteria bacterium]|nr:hypothetical protein [Gammaproteobacteria bacterium]